MPKNMKDKMSLSNGEGNNLVLSEEEKMIIRIMEKDRPSSFEEMIERSGIKADTVSTVIDMLLEKEIISEKIPI